MKLFSKWFVTASVGVLMGAGLTACNDDDVTYVDVDGAAPVVDLASTKAWVENGRDLVITGTVSDADGIASIDIVCHALMVNKTIDLLAINDGEAPTTYDLNYKIQTTQNIEEQQSYEVEITVTDVGGRSTSQTITSRLDGDQTAPQFTAYPTGNITVVVVDGEPAKFDLEFTVIDNKEIASVTIELVDNTDAANPVNIDGFPKTIQVGQKSYSHSETINFPDDKERELILTVEAADSGFSEDPHVTKISAFYSLSKALPPTMPIWLCDVATTAELSEDVFGVPMLIDNVGDNLYEARYYNEKAGTEICFLGQKTDFNPTCLGPSKENPEELGTKLDRINKIVLDQAGVYYLIKLNTLDKTYEISTYTIEEAVDPVQHMTYGGNDLNTWNDWNAAEPWWQEFFFGPFSGFPGDRPVPTDVVKRMVQDNKNPHIYVMEDWNLAEGEEMNFVLHNWHHDGWWNYVTWRVDNSEDPDKFMYYGYAFPDVASFDNRPEGFKGNADYFQYKYGNVSGFDMTKWAGDEGYRKQYVPDNWAKPVVKKGGTYKLIFDAHLERAKLVPQK